ncbi:LytTR family DNA-binding domain-containing protein [Candidatus Chlorohelix sp.]|uniref:LytR/AlgR family response regulator transcription factor n=1 Tax=Candidatus Chlorohelix sp. TaxID=3139201 RepID=UPI0030465722
MPKRLKILIVDDEQLARADLQYMLKKMPEVESVSECTNATEALELLNGAVLDALFLDIEMPGLNGLKAVKIINQLQNPPLIVFVTAYDEHAAKAFELNAVDYLVKPYSEKRLAQAITKIQKAQSSGAVNFTQEEQANKAHFKKIPVQKDEGVLLINLADVRYIVAYDDRVFVNTLNEQFLCRFSLAELEQRLNTQGFVRIHRSYIANLQYIVELQPFFNGTYNLIIDDKKHTILPVSRSRIKLLRSLIEV